MHDLRHTAATIMISSQVPLAVVSKTLRHSTLSTTVNLYSHLLPHAAREAVTALGEAYKQADLAADSEGRDAAAWQAHAAILSRTHGRERELPSRYRHVYHQRMQRVRRCRRTRWLHRRDDRI